MGEPVAYPRIAEFLAALHRRRISSMLSWTGVSYIGIMEKKMETTIVYWGYNRVILGVILG